MRLKQSPMRIKTISNEIKTTSYEINRYRFNISFCANNLSVEVAHFPYEPNNLNFYEIKFCQTFALTEDSKTLALTTSQQRLCFSFKY